MSAALDGTRTRPLDETAPSAGYRLIGVALAVAGVLGFSLRPVLIKLAYAYAEDPVTLIALRMIFSLPFLLAAALFARRGGAATQAQIAGRDWLPNLGLGFLGYYASSFLDFLGLQYVSAGLGRLLLFLYPTVVVILSAIFLGQRIRGRAVLALLVTYAGLALVLSHAIGGDNPNLPLGAALVFAGSVTYAVYLVAGSQVIRRVGSLRFAAYATTVASLCCIAQFLMLRPLAALDLPAAVYFIAVIMAVFSTVLPVFMTAEALKRIGASQVAMIGALGPVSTIALGWVGLDEAMTALQLAGAALVLGGVLLVSVKPSKPA
jgi:drug/metabolite transporter (DMT)-like permease